MYWKTWLPVTLFFLLFLGTSYSACAFTAPTRFDRICRGSGASTSLGRRYHLPRLLANDPQRSTEEGDIQKEKGILDLIFNPYESKIPKEIEKEIFAAEANTQAAKDRTRRITLYAVVAFIGVLCAFFNGFITELRTSPAPDGSLPPPDVLDTVGFGWVSSNFLFVFLFTNKIGGFICLLGGGACGLLAEAEYDTRRINAEKIFDEMQRRRAAKEGPPKKKNANDISKKAKRRSGKESKRMNALSEVTFEAESSSEPEVNFANIVHEDRTIDASPENPNEATVEEERSEGVSVVKDNIGVLGKIKEFYDKADSMAATQALLLNKKLEDEGLIEKITDESGLKVIGKDAAAKLNENNKPSASDKTDA